MYLFRVFPTNPWKFDLIFINSCETPEQLIAQNRIYDGMTKAALWSAMVDVVIQDDITPKDYILVSNNVDDLKEILSKLKDDKTLISYQLNK